MPLQNNTRLDRVVRKKLRRLLRGFYEKLRNEAIPTRFVELFHRAGSPEHRAPGEASPAPASIRRENSAVGERTPSAIRRRDR
jgi:hypothetical protein